jgi:hypothetical protein
MAGISFICAGLSLGLAVLLAPAGSSFAAPLDQAAGADRPAGAQPTSGAVLLRHLISIRSGAAALGIAPSQIDAILAAGGELHCSGRVKHNSATLNAWFLTTSTAVFTNSHAVLDVNGAPRAPLGECHFTPFANPARQYPIAADLGRIRVGSARPFQDDYRTDLARIPLSAAVPGARPLRVSFRPVELAVGDELVLVARRPSISGPPGRPIEAVMETCRVRMIDRQAGLPDGIVTNCFPTPGLSGGLYFKRSAAGDLVPVAMVEGSDDKRNPSRTLAVALDESFRRLLAPRSRRSIRYWSLRRR